MEDAFFRSKTAFENSIENNPCDWQPYIGLGDVYAETDNPEALTLFAKAIVLNEQKAKKAMDEIGEGKGFRKRAEIKARELKSIMEKNREEAISETLGSTRIVTVTVNASL